MAMQLPNISLRSLANAHIVWYDRNSSQEIPRYPRGVVQSWFGGDGAGVDKDGGNDMENVNQDSDDDE